MASQPAPDSKRDFGLKIGAKLGLMSGLAIVLVAGMFAYNLYSERLVSAEIDMALKQEDISRDVAVARAAAVGLNSAAVTFALPTIRRS